MTLQASDLSNFKASFISEQFSVTKIQIFSFRKEKCLSVWSYDKNISMYILTKTYLYKKHVFVQRDLQERVIYKNDSRFEAIRLFIWFIIIMTKRKIFKHGSSLWPDLSKIILNFNTTGLPHWLWTKLSSPETSEFGSLMKVEFVKEWVWKNPK